MAGNSLDELLAAVGVANKEVAARSQTVQAIMEENKATAADAVAQAALAGDSAGNTPEVVAAQAAARMKAQKESKAAAAALGTDPDAASYIIAETGRQWEQASRQAISAKQEVVAKMNSKFMDNPAQYVLDQLTMGDSINAADAAESLASSLKDRITFAQNATQNAVATNNAIAETITAASAQSQLMAVQARIQLQVDQTKIQNAGIYMQGLQNLNSMTAEQVQFLGTANGAIMQDKQYKMSLQQFEQNRQAQAMQLKMLSLQLEDREAAKAQQAVTVDFLQKGLGALGLPEAALQPGPKLMAMLNTSPLYKQALEVGMNITAAGGRPVLTQVPSQLANAIAEYNIPMQSTDKKYRDFLTTAWSTVRDPAYIGKLPVTERYNVNKPEEVDAHLNKLISMEAQRQMSNIKTGDASNIYAPPTLTAVLEVPAIAKSRLAQKVITPQVLAGGGALKEFQPQQLAAMTVEGIKAGKIPLDAETRRDFANLFSAAVQINNNLGIPVGKGLPLQVGYKTTMQSGYGFNKPAVINMADPIAAGAYLDEALAAGTWRDLVQRTVKSEAGAFLP